MHQKIESPTPSEAASPQCPAGPADPPSPTQAELSLAFAHRQLASVIKKGTAVSDCHTVYSVWAISGRLHTSTNGVFNL